MRVSVENTAGMSCGREWKERSAVGEMPSGTCAMERVLEELPSHPADLDIALTSVFAETDPTEAFDVN